MQAQRTENPRRPAILLLCFVVIFTLGATTEEESRKKVQDFEQTLMNIPNEADRAAPVRTFFAGLKDSQEKIAAIGMMDERYVYQIPKNLYSELLGPMIADADLEVRVAAAQAPRYTGNSADFPTQVIALLREADIKAKVAALQCMGGMDQDEVPRLIRDHLTHPDARVRSAAMEALTVSITRQTTYIAQMLKDPDNQVKKMALLQLARLQAVHYLPQIRALGDDKDAGIRAEAVMAITEIGGPDPAPWIAGKLNDPDELVRAQAVHSLEKLQSIAYRAEVAKMLEDKSMVVRHAAARAIGMLGDRSDLPKLQELMTDPEEGIRRIAAESIQRLEKR